MFIFWIIAITVLSVAPHADDSLMEKSNLTSSGMEKHLAGYFLAALLCYYSFKRDKNNMFFVLLSCFFLFLYSLALEVIQFFLPYRTFNPDDIAANGFGIFLFVVIRSLYLQISMRKQKS